MSSNKVFLKKKQAHPASVAAAKTPLLSSNPSVVQTFIVKPIRYLEAYRKVACVFIRTSDEKGGPDGVQVDEWFGDAGRNFEGCYEADGKTPAADALLKKFSDCEPVAVKLPTMHFSNSAVSQIASQCLDNGDDEDRGDVCFIMKCKFSYYNFTLKATQENPNPEPICGISCSAIKIAPCKPV